MSKQLMKGNEALAEAALRAGCRFYSGYPITPQTEILEYLAKRMDEVGARSCRPRASLRASTCSSVRQRPARVR